MSLAIGVDLGGTKIEVGLVDASGIVKKHILMKTNVDAGPEDILGDVASAIKSLLSGLPQDEVIGVGVGIAGQIEKSSGKVLFAPNLFWKDVPLLATLSQLLKLPVAVTNDVRAATWGEWLYGAGCGCEDFVCLFVGTGIGSGIVSGGRMLEGGNNAAGEVGHITIDLGGPVCNCGNRGCFESIAGGRGIARRAKELIEQDSVAGKKLLQVVGKEITTITAKDVFEGNAKGEPLSMKIVGEVKDALIAGVASIVNAFNPSRLILGGSVIQYNPMLIEAIKKGVSSRALKAATDHLEIVEAKLKSQAGVIGAAAYISVLQSRCESR